eukprot:21216-Chlamydomonas_euryale.AAC.16
MRHEACCLSHGPDPRILAAHSPGRTIRYMSLHAGGTLLLWQWSPGRPDVGAHAEGRVLQRVQEGERLLPCTLASASELGIIGMTLHGQMLGPVFRNSPERLKEVFLGVVRSSAPHVILCSLGDARPRIPEARSSFRDFQTQNTGPRIPSVSTRPAAHLLGEALLGKVAHGVVVGVRQEMRQAVPRACMFLGVVHQARAEALDLLAARDRAERNLAKRLRMERSVGDATNDRSVALHERCGSVPPVKHQAADVFLHVGRQELHGFASILRA